MLFSSSSSSTFSKKNVKNLKFFGPFDFPENSCDKKNIKKNSPTFPENRPGIKKCVIFMILIVYVFFNGSGNLSTLDHFFKIRVMSENDP